VFKPNELATFLNSIRSAVARDLRPELTSDHARARADAVTSVLDQLILDCARGDVIARERMPVWLDLEARLRSLGFDDLDATAPPSTDFLGPFAQLQRQVGALQRAVGSERARARLDALLDRSDPRLVDWIMHATRALLDFHGARKPPGNEAIATGSRLTRAPDETEQLRAGLNRYLKSRFPTLPEAPVLRVRLSPGGYVKQTAILSLIDNPELPTRVVLRKDMAKSITGTSVRDEYPFIEQAHAIGLAAPQPLLLEADADVLGGSFMLMTEIADSTPSGPYFPEERPPDDTRVGPAFGHEVAATLARLHSRTRVAADPASPDYRQLIADSRSAWASAAKTPYSLGADLGYAWLLSHPLPPDRPACTVHGDFGAHNILVRDGHLAALIDWELAHVGDPAEDLAQCRMMLLPGIMDWTDFVAAYVAAGGDPDACRPEAVAWFCVWIYLKHGLFNALLRANFLSGERPDIMAANVVTHYHALMMEYQARALGIALAETGC
jgi:aminoglycoside phosphotransferase (APT) family kinase protein